MNRAGRRDFKGHTQVGVHFRPILNLLFLGRVNDAHIVWAGRLVMERGIV
jgi:hypothetical protein